MHRSYKFLRIIFLVLVLVVIGEFIFYLFYNYKTFNSRMNIFPSRLNSPEAKFTKEALVTLCPTPDVKALYLKNCNDFYKDEMARKGNYALNSSMLLYLQDFKDDILVSSIAENKYKGKIVKVDNKPGLMANEIPYQFRFKLEGESGYSADFYFDTKTMGNVKVFKLEKEAKKAVGFDELKSGDEIEINETADLRKPTDEGILSTEIIIK